MLILKETIFTQIPFLVSCEIFISYEISIGNIYSLLSWKPGLAIKVAFEPA